MTASPQPAWQPPAWQPAADRWSAGRIVALVFGILLLIPAIGLLIGGGVLLWADTVSRTDDGYVMSDSEALSSGGHALVSERIQLSTGADWVPLSAALGTARIEVTGADRSADLFVGLAPAADVAGYLDGVGRTVIDDLGFDGRTPNEPLLPGGPPPGPPAGQDFWTTQSSGSGPQQLSWSPAEGDWMLVIMNADGSAGVDADARIGATFPGLGGLAWGLTITALLLATVAVLLIVLAVHRSYGRPQTVGPPPPGWRPPTQGTAPAVEETPPVPGGPRPPPGEGAER